MVIAINPNDPELQPADSYENMKVRAKEANFTFPYLFDDGQHAVDPGDAVQGHRDRTAALGRVVGRL